ncbi:hypothetical protein B0H19DRAFT_1072066 [Mycena capillaripes]|nr:hypothetical protein B0H19DRAFT_1072066 [Mycena capillaripes]
MSTFGYHLLPLSLRSTCHAAARLCKVACQQALRLGKTPRGLLDGMDKGLSLAKIKASGAMRAATESKEQVAVIADQINQIPVLIPLDKQIFNDDCIESPNGVQLERIRRVDLYSILLPPSVYPGLGTEGLSKWIAVKRDDGVLNPRGISVLIFLAGFSGIPWRANWCDWYKCGVTIFTASLSGPISALPLSISIL